jgi:hypothetical protein
MVPAFLLGAGAAMADPAGPGPQASALAILETQDRSHRTICLTSTWDSSPSPEAVAAQVSTETPPAVWPPPAPQWLRTQMGPTTIRTPISLNPASTSVMRWLGAQETLLSTRGSRQDFLVTRSYEHVRFDHHGRVLSSRRGQLESVITIDTSTSSVIGSRRYGR